jgi:hypothetical protein
LQLKTKVIKFNLNVFKLFVVDWWHKLKVWIYQRNFLKCSKDDHRHSLVITLHWNHIKTSFSLFGATILLTSKHCQSNFQRCSLVSTHIIVNWNQIKVHKYEKLRQVWCDYQVYALGYGVYRWWDGASCDQPWSC